MQAVPIIVSPTHSKETRLLATSAVTLHRFFKSKGIRSNILLGFGARKLPLLTAMNAAKGRRIALFYYGHGTQQTLIGSEVLTRPFSRCHLVTKNLKNPIMRKMYQSLKDGLVFTIACDSAANLGTFMVDNGIRAFVGSIKPMEITHDLDFDRDGVRDMRDVMTIAPRSLVEGANLSQAVENYRTRALEMFNAYNFKVSAPDLQQMMDRNIKYYKIIGDGGWMFDG